MSIHIQVEDFPASSRVYLKLYHYNRTAYFQLSILFRHLVQPMNSLIIKLMKVVTARMKCYSIVGMPSIVLIVIFLYITPYITVRFRLCHALASILNPRTIRVFNSLGTGKCLGARVRIIVSATHRLVVELS